MSSPTLLSMPREIRNIIYGYLSHELVIDWGYRPSPFPLGGHALARLHIREAPLPSVLLSCAQIYHEYSQDKRFTNPSLEIHPFDDVSLRLQEGQSTNHMRACKVLERIVRVDFFIYAKMTWCQAIIEVDNALEVLEPTIALLAPRLHTMRLVFESYEDSTQYVTEDLKALRAKAARNASTMIQPSLRHAGSPPEHSLQAY
jgi:hypothetical protein